MHVFVGEDLNDVYLGSLVSCRSYCTQSSVSRVGDVYDFGPAYFEFTNPVDQLLMLRGRGFNPYFAIVEAAWILSGKNSLSPLNKIISNYAKYSDDGETLNGAYGFRMRSYFQCDQLSQCIALLKSEPTSRRAVLTLYSPEDLARGGSLDIPCNTTVYLKIRYGKLDITIVNRSNDLFMGVPYNVFVFSCIQKYVALNLGLGIGVQRHFTDSLHLYKADFERVENVIKTNSDEEIVSWRKSVSPANLYSSMLSEYEAICELDRKPLRCSYTKKVFADYFSYKSGKSSVDFVQALPYDKLGLSARLWVESFE